MATRSRLLTASVPSISTSKEALAGCRPVEFGKVQGDHIVAVGQRHVVGKVAIALALIQHVIVGAGNGGGAAIRATAAKLAVGLVERARCIDIGRTTRVHRENDLVRIPWNNGDRHRRHIGLCRAIAGLEGEGISVGRLRIGRIGIGPGGSIGEGDGALATFGDNTVSQGIFIDVSGARVPLAPVFLAVRVLLCATGASFTGVTVMVTVPLAVPPLPSLTV